MEHPRGGEVGALHVDGAGSGLDVEEAIVVELVEDPRERLDLRRGELGAHASALLPGRAARARGEVAPGCLEEALVRSLAVELAPYLLRQLGRVVGVVEERLRGLERRLDQVLVRRALSGGGDG